MSPSDQRRASGGAGRDDRAGITVGQWRLRYIIVGIVTAVWVGDVVSVWAGWSNSAQPLVHAAFIVVVSWVLGIDLGIISTLSGGSARKDDR